MYPVNKQTAFNAGNQGHRRGAKREKCLGPPTIKRVFYSCFGACLWGISSWVTYRKHR